MTLSRELLAVHFHPEADGYLYGQPLPAEKSGRRVAFLAERSASLLEDGFIEVRGRNHLGSWTQWRFVPITWQEEVLSVGGLDFDHEVREIEFRIEKTEFSSLASITLSLGHAREFQRELEDQDAEGVDTAALSVKGGINSRASWGARPRRCGTRESKKSRLTVHHTVTAHKLSGSFSRQIRAIQAFHMNGRGWCDIAYHYGVTTDGQLWELREINFRGGHVANNNSENIGVVFIGCFEPGACSGYNSPVEPPAAMLEAAREIVHAAAKEYGFSVNKTNVRGHRELRSTSCPGKNVFDRLVDIRKAPDTRPKPKLPTQPFGEFEILARGPAGVRVAGFALDGDALDWTRVRITIDGVLSASLKADYSRPDVAERYPGFTARHGFDAVFPDVEPGTRELCAEIVNQGEGQDAFLGCKSIEVRVLPEGEILSLDVTKNDVLVKGWAVDPDTIAPINVEWTLDGEIFHSATANKFSRRVGEFYRGYGNNHGFEETISMFFVSPGEHELCTLALNEGRGSGATTLGCQSFTRTPGAEHPFSLAARVVATVFSRPATEAEVAALGIQLFENGSGLAALKALADRLMDDDEFWEIRATKTKPEILAQMTKGLLERLPNPTELEVLVPKLKVGAYRTVFNDLVEADEFGSLHPDLGP